MPQLYSGKSDFLKVLSDDKQKVYTFDFPVGTSMGEAYDIITFLRAEIWKKLEENKKAEDKKKINECCKPALHEKREVPKETVLPKKEDNKKESTKKDLKETLLGKDKK